MSAITKVQFETPMDIRNKCFKVFWSTIISEACGPGGVSVWGEWSQLTKPLCFTVGPGPAWYQLHSLLRQHLRHLKCEYYTPVFPIVFPWIRRSIDEPIIPLWNWWLIWNHCSNKNQKPFLFHQFWYLLLSPTGSERHYSWDLIWCKMSRLWCAHFCYVM